MLPRRVIATAALTTFAVLVPAAAASANTAPNAYSPAGVSWVDVPVGDRVYLENFGRDYDDYEIYYVGSGITCDYNAITATGPFLTAQELDETNCVDSGSAPFDPIDTSTRLGAVPFGFSINFFGTTYDSGYPNTNGGLYFDNPDGAFDNTLARLASRSESSAMYPLGGDLYYNQQESNLWVAQTTVDGSPAVVFGWEKFYNCCSGSIEDEDMSFQLVLIKVGSNDFDAWFNYASLHNFNQGYTAPTALVNLRSGVTVGSNILVARNVTNVPTACSEADYDELGDVTDTLFIEDIDDGVYFRLVDATARTISLWSDDTCTTPITVNVLQDEATDLVAYLQLEDDDSTSYDALGIGWSTYNQTTGAIEATEFAFNVDAAELADDAANPLITRSLNTTVPGRFVIGQRGGATVGDPELVSAAAPTLADTGSSDLTGPALLGAALLLLGAGALWSRMRRRDAAA